MKTRDGFVANSSSSSFLIPTRTLTAEQKGFLLNNEAFITKIKSIPEMAYNMREVTDLNGTNWDEVVRLLQDEHVVLVLNDLNPTEFIECSGDSDLVYYMEELVTKFGVDSRYIKYPHQGWS